MNLVSELRRRNVFRMAALYVVAAWLIMQVAEVVIGLVKLPDWIGFAILGLLAVGFPIALLFSWFYEITAEGISLETDVASEQSITQGTGRRIDFIVISLLLAAVILFAYDKWSVGEPPEKSIAVLPFENMSADPEQEYFSDGIAEELLNLLAQIPELRVISRTSAFSFKGQNLEIAEIARRLNVAHVLEGSVRKSGDKLRITAQLIKADDGYHLWSNSYDRELGDIFVVQDEIAAKIMTALQVHLGAGGPARVTATSDTAAYDAYLKGRQALRERNPQSIEAAQDFFEFATARDPDFALAWAGQAQARFLRSAPRYGSLKEEDAIAGAQTLVDRAFALDPELAEAHAVQSALHGSSGQTVDALASIDRAIASKTGDTEFYLSRYIALSHLGRYRESREMLLLAQSIDPVHPSILKNRLRDACTLGLEPVTNELLASVEGLWLPWRIAECHRERGELAKAFELASQLEGPYREVNVAIARSYLKDCETPWPTQPGFLDKDQAVFLQRAGCDSPEAAMQAYAELTPDQQKDNKYVLDNLSVLQLRNSDYAAVLDTLDLAHGNSESGRELDRKMYSRRNLAMNRSFALRQLGQNAQAAQLLRHERDVIDQAKREGVTRGYQFLEAKLLLLEGNEAASIESLDAAILTHDIAWPLLHDPVLRALLEPEKLEQFIARLDEHINAERAKLGWLPADF